MFYGGSFDIFPSFSVSVRGSGQVARTCSSRMGRPDLRDRLHALHVIKIVLLCLPCDATRLQAEFLHIREVPLKLVGTWRRETSTHD